MAIRNALTPANFERTFVAMKAKASRKQRDYPVTSRAIRAAERGRQMANKLTEEEAEEHFRRAMLRIYGGQPKEATLTGHQRSA